MNSDRLRELAAGFASGELDLAEQSEFRALIEAAPAEGRLHVGKIVDAAALLALSLGRQSPASSLKDKILACVKPPEPTPHLFDFIRGGYDESGWIPMRVPGAFVKPLSIQKEKGYAVVLGKLLPKTSYPPHQHIGAEQILVLSGDLQIGGVVLRAGDFHNACAGSTHGVNYSDAGCTILAVVSTEDLATLVPG